MYKNKHTRNHERSARTRRNDVVKDPEPRPLRVVATAVTVAVSWVVNGISIPCATVNSVISMTGEKSLLENKWAQTKVQFSFQLPSLIVWIKLIKYIS